MKKILILGAGIYQLPLIETAKRMGLYTIVVSIPGKYPGFAAADRVCYENTVDAETVLEIARREKIDGIATAGTDVAVPTLGRVCDALGLPGPCAQAAQIASDKRRMKERYEAAGVRTARFREIPLSLSGRDLEEKLADLRPPLIFKTVDASGSRGIMRVEHPAQFGAARQNVAENTRRNSYLVEEFLEGEEFGAQAFVRNHRLEFMLLHGDTVFHGDAGVPIGHYAPFDPGEGQAEEARRQLERAVAAMGLDNCALNADFILSNGQVYVIELGGRSGATCLAELVSLYYGYDYYEKILRVALGEPVSFASDQAVPNASRLLMSDRSGVIRSLRNDNAASDGICAVHFDYGVGDHVRAFRVGPDRIGHVIAKGRTLSEAQETLREALEKIVIEVEPDTGNPEEKKERSCKTRAKTLY